MIIPNRFTALYLRDKASYLREEQPAVVEVVDDNLASTAPYLASGPGGQIKIPVEIMPDEPSARQYIDLYFINVHPYVPVLDKCRFYWQWTTAPDSISPLILAAIFAIGCRLTEQPAPGQQWLAFASSMCMILVRPLARIDDWYQGMSTRSWTSLVLAHFRLCC